MKMLLALIAAVAVHGSLAFAAQEDAATDWNGPAIAISIRADKAAFIDTGCGNYKIDVGQWNTDGKEMPALSSSGLPMANPPRIVVPITAVIKDGSLELTIRHKQGKPQVYILKPGKGQPFVHCA